jgi:hypothetical protein
MRVVMTTVPVAMGTITNMVAVKHRVRVIPRIRTNTIGATITNNNVLTS